MERVGTGGEGREGGGFGVGQVAGGGQVGAGWPVRRRGARGVSLGGTGVTMGARGGERRCGGQERVLRI